MQSSRRCDETHLRRPSFGWSWRNIHDRLQLLAASWPAAEMEYSLLCLFRWEPTDDADSDAADEMSRNDPAELKTTRRWVDAAAALAPPKWPKERNRKDLHSSGRTWNHTRSRLRLMLYLGPQFEVSKLMTRLGRHQWWMLNTYIDILLLPVFCGRRRIQLRPLEE